MSGNNVDFSQRTAGGDPDEEEFASLPDWKAWEMQRNPALLDRYVRYLQRKNSGELNQPQAAEPEEEKAFTRKADDEFWSNPEAQQEIYRRRHGKL